MIHLGLLLHCYQPWWQFEGVLEKICVECYRPLFDLVNAHDGKHLTLNVQWALVEQLEKDGAGDVLSSIKKALADDKIELVSTAAYHPILPLISSEMAERQILCDIEMKREWGIEASGKGFYLSELAYDPAVISTLKKFGAEWTLTDDVPFVAKFGGVPFDRIVAPDDLGVFLRSNWWSGLITGENPISWREFRNRFPKEIRQWTGGKECYVILAMDAETFGHHHKNLLSDFLAPLLEIFGENENEGVKIEPLGKIFDAFPKIDGYVPPGSWATTADDFRAGNHFPFWRSSWNRLHKIMWEISDLAVSCLNRKVRHDLEILKCQTSCQFWHVAGGRYNVDLALRDISHALSEICRRSVGDPKKEQAARRLYRELIGIIGS
jgi:predicted glycosyl hydrolase (DUF1957 family)